MIKRFQSTHWGSVSPENPLHVPGSLHSSTSSIKPPTVSSSGSHLGCDIAQKVTGQGPFFPLSLKLPGTPEAHVLPVEACVSPKPLGPPEAHVLPEEACVPPKPLGPQEACVPLKPQGPSGNPSSSMASQSQAKYSLNPSHHVWLVHLDSLSTASLLTHTHCMAKLSNPAITTLSAHHPTLPSPDIFCLEPFQTGQQPSS